MSRRILIVGPSWVGDMVMAQALFISLQNDARAAGTPLAIDVLAPAWSRPLLVRMPEVRGAGAEGAEASRGGDAGRGAEVRGGAAGGSAGEGFPGA
jgi:heptosyltransferase-2